MTTRRKFLVQLGSAGLVLLQAPVLLAAPDDLVLVLNAKNATRTDAALAKRLFVGETVFWAGNVPVHVVLRPADSSPGQKFFKAIGITPARFKRIWQEKQLSGQGVVPETIAAAQAIIAKIAADPGGMAVALASEVPAGTPGVRTIALG